MQLFKVIIFDIDGTLLNTDELYFQLLKYELNKLNVSFNEKQYALHGLDDSVFHLGLDEKTAQRVRDNVLKNYYNDQILKKLRFKNGAHSIIRSLSKQYKLAIGSGEKIGQIERYLKYQNLNRYFHFIGHGALVLYRKSNPDYFRQIAKFFKVKPGECLMVGDSVFDANAAKAGCKVVIIPSKFTKHCIFNKECVILSNIKKLPLFLENIQHVHKIEKYPKHCQSWRESGAETESEYQELIQDSCGIACIRTILAFYHKPVPKPIPLRKRAQDLNLYTKNGMVLKKTGLLLKDFKLKTKYYSNPPLKKLAKLILKAPIIASIKGQNSGHLVVVYGVLIENNAPKTFYYYDSAAEIDGEIIAVEWQKISNQRVLQVLPEKA